MRRIAVLVALTLAAGVSAHPARPYKVNPGPWRSLLNIHHLPYNHLMAMQPDGSIKSMDGWPQLHEWHGETLRVWWYQRGCFPNPSYYGEFKIVGGRLKGCYWSWNRPNEKVLIE